MVVTVWSSRQLPYISTMIDDSFCEVMRTIYHRISLLLISILSLLHQFFGKRLFKSPFHLSGERPTLRLQSRGLHLRNRFPHRLSILRQSQSIASLILQPISASLTFCWIYIKNFILQRYYEYSLFNSLLSDFLMW